MTGVIARVRTLPILAVAFSASLVVAGLFARAATPGPWLRCNAHNRTEDLPCE